MAVLTKSKQVENYLRSSIINGRWRRGEMIPAERTMLTDFNVGRSTLREALNSLVKEGLVTRKPGSGTYVSDLSQRASIAITGSSANLSSPLGYWHQALIDKAQKVIAADGYSSKLWIGSGLYLSDTALFAPGNMQSTLGVLNTVHTEKFDRLLEQENVHSVGISNAVPASRYSVTLDYQELVREAKKALLSHGYSDFAVFCEGKDCSSLDDSVARMRSTMDKCLAEAVDNDPRRIYRIPASGESPPLNVYENFKEILAKPNCPRAFFFSDDGLFDQASRAILELGVKVPDELAIVTHSNVGKKFQFPVNVARVVFSADAVIEKAWSMLKQLLMNEYSDDPVQYISPEWVPGDSL